ncbi:MAG: hypothetical protein A2Z95_02735 [Gallionellales bacterium GWA2_60_18]|nr:MAG: hypothetical protein A2Z95_02735 [Gallionellales bacterium GWA2_60_18]
MRWTSRVMMVLMVGIGMPASSFAGMVETDQTVNHALAEQGRARIMALVDRDDVRAQLEAKGVTSEQAKARVNALTDEEALQVSGKLDQLPAGGEIIGVMFTIFIVLLVTDILGFTKVFSFTRTANR